MTHSEWIDVGSKLFGPDTADWRFLCPSCQLEQGRAEFAALGMPDKFIDRILAYSCVRRWTDQTCLHKGGGPILILVVNRPTFDFYHAPDPDPLAR